MRMVVRVFWVALLLFLIDTSACAQTSKAKNIILFLADAAGVPTVNAASLYGYGEPQKLFVQSWPHIALSDTSAASEWVTDSAAGMTAIVTGKKTPNGVLSMDSSTVRGKKNGGILKTILEYAEERGLSTGVVTDMSIADATPAACYAHVNDRDKYEEIILQAFAPRFGDGVDVMLGTGRRAITDSLKKTGKDLARISSSKHRPIYSSLKEIPPDNLRPVAILDEPLNMPAAAKIAIDRLSGNPKGYFLMIESDAHTDHLQAGLDRLVAFDKLIREIAKRVDSHETLLLFTADHSFDLRVESGRRGEPLLEGIAEWWNILRDVNVRVRNTHTGEEVAAAAVGAGSERVSGFMPNTRLFEIMLAAWGWPKDGVRPASKPGGK